MKMKNRFIGILLLTAWIVFTVGNLYAEAGRNPFNAPPKKKSSYNYYSASRNLILTGIIRFEDSDRCMVRVATSGRFYVLGPEEEVKVPLWGRKHTFTVAKIQDKSVFFKGKNGIVYEVEIR